MSDFDFNFNRKEDYAFPSLALFITVSMIKLLTHFRKKCDSIFANVSFITRT